MMRKYVSRLLALALVLCMVVLCVPVRAYADAPVRPEGMTDEEWDEFAVKLAEELGVEDVDREEMIERFEEKVDNND